MKKTILTLLILVLACQLTAQNRNDNKHSETVAIGIKAGGILPYYFYSDNADLNALAFKGDLYGYDVRPTVGLNVEIPLFNGIMYVAPEVAFATRGDSREFFVFDGDSPTCYRAKVNYLEANLPISVAIPVASWFKPYVFAAPLFGVVLDTVGPFRSEIVQYEYEGVHRDTVAVSTSNMSLYDYGLTVGAGLRFRLNFSSFSMIVKLEGGYYFGFCDTYSPLEHHDQATAINLNSYTGHQYNITGERLNRGIEGSITIAIPLEFHSSDDCFYWSDVQKKKNRGRGLFGF